MLAICKRELSSIFHSVIGYVFIAVILFFCGIYFTAYNLGSGAPYFAYTLSSIIFIILLMTPILTMRIMTEDKKQNTDQLLYTAPISVTRVIIGKYLSLLITFLIPVAILCVYPLIMSLYGTIGYLETYTAILGFAAFGAMCLAIGMFVSSITENQIVSAILTLLFLYIGYMMTGITQLLFKSDNIFTTILNSYNFFNRLSSFFDGNFKLSDLIYFITLAVLFLFFTYQVVQKKRFSVSSKRIMRGAFSVTSIILSIALAVGINFGITKIPEQYTVFDVTPQNIYSIGNQTKAILKNLKNDITIYVLAAKDTQDSTIRATLEQYEALSKHIKVEFKDPTKFPTFVSQYSSDTPTTNSLIIESEKRYTIVDYNDLFLSELDSQTYQQMITGYDGEGKITSAIDYVTSDTLPKMYIISGHNELDMPASLISEIGKENIETQTINLFQLEAVPEDAGCIMIIAPTTDFTADDTKKVLDYMQNGGNAVIFSTYTDQPMDNFNELLQEYGCSIINGIIADADSSHANQNPFYLLPDISGSEITSSLFENNRFIFIPYAHGIEIANTVRDTLELSQILKTSDKSYIKEDPNTQVLEQEEQDVNGPFTVGVYATEDINDKTTHLLYIASEYMVNSDANAAVSGANYELIMNALGKMVSHEVTVSIPAKEYNAASLIVNTSSFLLWCIVTIFIIPFTCLIGGIVVWLSRRKK